MEIFTGNEVTLTKTLSTTRRKTSLTILAWIFAILFIISSIGVLYSYFPTRKLLKPDFYQGALEKVDIYQRLPEAIAGRLAAYLSPGADQSETRVAIMIFDQADWEALLVKIIDPSWLKTQSESILEQFIYLLLSSPDPVNTPLEISVEEIKQRLAGAEGAAAVDQIIEAQPPCSLDQLLGLVQTGLGMESQLDSLLCRPPEFVLSELDPMVETFLSTATSQVPDKVRFYLPQSALGESNPESLPISTPELLPEPIRILRQANRLISWSPLLPLFFLLVLTVIVVRSPRDFFAWWGGTLFSAGLVSLCLLLIMVPAAKFAFNTYLPTALGNLSNLPEFLVEIGLIDLYQELASHLLRSIVIPASAISAAGFIFLVIAYILGRNSRNPKPHDQQFAGQSG